MKEERGSILLSVLLFVSLSAVMISGLAVVTKHQVVQLRQTQDSYYARSMIEMTETLLKEQIDSGMQIQSGEIAFSEGVVYIQRKSPEEIELTAILTNQFSTKKMSELPLKTQEANDESNELIKKEDSNMQNQSEKDKPNNIQLLQQEIE